MILSIVVVGCIGERYEFKPPKATIGDNDQALVEANVSWTGEDNKEIEHKVDDPLQLALSQEPMNVSSNADNTLDFSVHDSNKSLSYEPQKVTIIFWKDGHKVASNDMDVSDMNSFQFKNPSEPGSYVIEVNLDTDNGKAQYVGNLIVE
jgi:hypothetical protein